MPRSLFQSGTLLTAPVASVAQQTVRTITYNGNQYTTDQVLLLDATNGSYYFTLATAVGFLGILRFAVISTNANVFTVVTQLGQVITQPGSAPVASVELGPLVSQAPFAAIELVSDGANWKMTSTVLNAAAVIPYGPLAFRGSPTANGTLYFANDAEYETLYQTQSGLSGDQWTVLASNPPTPVIISLPVISGTLAVGDVLSVTSGTWANSPTLVYQWLRSESPISGATSNTYTLQSADEGQALTVLVTATNGAGSMFAESLPVVLLATGTGTVAQPVTLLTSAGVASGNKLTFGDSAAVPGSAAAAPYLKFPVSPPLGVTDNPVMRFIIRNNSAGYTPIQPVLLNSDNSLYAGNGGNFPIVEPGNRLVAGGTSWGTINVSVPGLPTASMKVALQNTIIGDPAGFSVTTLAWMA